MLLARKIVPKPNAQMGQGRKGDAHRNPARATRLRVMDAALCAGPLQTRCGALGEQSLREGKCRWLNEGDGPTLFKAWVPEGPSCQDHGKHWNRRCLSNWGALSAR